MTVTYNSADDVQACLASAVASAAEARLAVEVIVVDNASTDGSVAVARSAVPDAMVLCNPVNVGFGAANNQAFAVARGEHVLLLNPDARLGRDALGSLHRFLDHHPLAAAAAPAIRDAGPGGAESAGMLPGLRAALAHFLFLNRVLPERAGSPWQGLAIRRTRGVEPRRVEWATAAALLVRASAMRDVGGFDPAIFMYGEDVDLCDRLGRAGWEVWLVPAATARHSIASSQGGISVGWVDGIHNHYAHSSNRAQLALFDLVLTLGLGLRAAAALAGHGGERHRRRMLAASRRALTLALGAVARGHGPA